MVFGQALDVVLQRIQAGGGEDAGLAHAAAQHLAPAQRLRDERPAAAQHRADRRAQPLGQADGNAVEAPHRFARADAEFHRGIADARAVQVRREAALVREPGCRVEVGGRHDAPAQRILQREQTAAREVKVVRLDRALDVRQRQGAVGLVCDGLRLQAAEHGAASGLVLVGVRLLPDDVFVAALAVREQRDQVGLRARGREQRRFMAEQLGRARLQAVDRRVVAVDVVAHFGRGHGGAHGRARAGDGVASEVYQFAGFFAHVVSRYAFSIMRSRSSGPALRQDVFDDAFCPGPFRA